jgi:hypothetical protein
MSAAVRDNAALFRFALDTGVPDAMHRPRLKIVPHCPCDRTQASP